MYSFLGGIKYSHAFWPEPTIPLVGDYQILPCILARADYPSCGGLSNTPIIFLFWHTDCTRKIGTSDNPTTLKYAPQFPRINSKTFYFWAISNTLTPIAYSSLIWRILAPINEYSLSYQSFLL
jgi:hypothetical protein